MRLKLEKPEQFTKGIELISELVMEVRIKVNEFGVSITAMDPANVSMVGYTLPKAAFSVFEAEDEGLGVNLDDLKKILKRCGVRSALTLEKRDNFLDILIEDKARRSFSLGLIEIERDDIDFKTRTERMNFTTTIEIDAADLVSSIDDCAVVSDSCAFETEENKFIIDAKGLNTAKTEFTQDIKVEGENVKAKYALEYLQKFMKGAKFVDKVVIKFANDHPLMMEFKSEHMKLNFILAPRVESDE